MILRRFEGGPFQENAYLALSESSDHAVLVDPGAAAPRAVAALREEGRTPAAILLTHAHLDHVDGIPAVREAFPDVPIWLHPEDRPLYDAVPQQALAFGMPRIELPEPDRAIVPGETLDLGGDLRFQVRFAPGHAPGHVVFIHEASSRVLVGDVVFAGSIGRTDLPGGSYSTLLASIQEQILTLPDDMVLLPGHGPETTVGRERRSNPFLTGAVPG